MSLWTTTFVRHSIYTHVGVAYCRERVRQVLHELGFHLQWPRHRHLTAQLPDQADCVAQLHEWIAELPDEGELLCVDEATVRRHPTLTAQWCLVDDISEIPTGDDQTTVQVYGAVAPLTGRTH